MRDIQRFLRARPWITVAIVLMALAGGIGFELGEAKKPWIEQREVDARAAVGKPPSLRNYRRIWVWYGAAATALVFAGLAVSARWWADAEAAPRSKPLFGAGPAVRGFGWMLAGITLAGAFPRAARMDLSFWTDEDWATCSYVWGAHEEKPDGTLEFHRHPWSTTLWRCDRANNHILYSILARASLSGWNRALGHRPENMSEWAVRLPAFLAGLGGIVAMGLALRSFGHPLAGIIGAAALALHPLHINYSSEARGYSLMILLMILTLWAAFSALTGETRWRHWILFGAFQVLTLLAFSASIYAISLLNAAVASLIWLRPRRRDKFTSRVLWRRWMVVNASSACLYMTAALPALVQTLHFLDTSKMITWPMHAKDYTLIWSRLITGFNYSLSHPDNPIEIAVAAIPGGASCLWLLTGILVSAALRFGWRFRWNSLLIVSPIVALAVALAHNAANGRALFPQYLLPSFPGAMMAVSFLFEELGCLFAGGTGDGVLSASRLPRSLAPFGLTAAAAMLVFSKGYSILVTKPVEPFREAAAATRWAHEPPYSQRSQVEVISLWRSWKIYDPRVRTQCKTAESLKEAMRRATDSGKELYVVVGHVALAQRENPGFLAVVNNPALFEPLPTLWGRDLMTTLWPYRLKRGMPHLQTSR